MTTEQAQVKQFMQLAGQVTPDRPTIPTREVRELRVRLIAEELMELCDALNVDLKIDNTGTFTVCGVTAKEELNTSTPDCLRDAYDAILDLMVVVIGTGVAMGLTLKPGWEEVHKSNMSKFIDGHRREDGKWIKGTSYRPVRLTPILEQMLCDAVANEYKKP